MKIRQLSLLIAAASLLALSTGCELLVDFDRSKIDSSIAVDSAMPDSGRDSGSDASDEDSGTLDAMVIGDSGGLDADVTVDSGTDSGSMDAALDGSDDEDSGT